jgi:hypothetical protein
VSSFKIYRAAFASIDCSKPCTSTNTPRISCFQSRERKLWSWSDEVVALFSGVFKKGISDNAAYCVGTAVVFIGIATPISIPTRLWFV